MEVQYSPNTRRSVIRTVFSRDCLTCKSDSHLPLVTHLGLHCYTTNTSPFSNLSSKNFVLYDVLYQDSRLHLDVYWANSVFLILRSVEC